MGLYKQALSNALAVLEVREQTQGKQHLDTAGSCNLAGLIYSAQGRHKEAEPFYRRALAIRETALGAEHPDTLRVKGNLERMLAGERPEET